MVAVVRSIITQPVQVIPLVLLALILGLPGLLIIVTASRLSYVLWMFIYLLSLPIWNFVLPTYAFWKFDDFSWGDTRKTAGETTKKAGIEYQGEFDSSKITNKRWAEFEREKRSKSAYWGSRENLVGSNANTWTMSTSNAPYNEGGYYSDA
jgi:chitin synthase